MTALLLTPPVRNLAFRFGAIDEPGARKVHPACTARLGGVAVFGAISAGMVAAFLLEAAGWIAVWVDPGCAKALFFGVPIIFLAGLADDIKPLRPMAKFIPQSVAAFVAIYFGMVVENVSLFGGEPFDLGFFAWLLTFVWIVGITNAFNLIDGLDGLAVGLASIAAATSAVIFFMTGDVANGVLLSVIVGAAVGFLRFNFNPATIFLGDSGSLTLGYILAVTAVSGSQKQALALATLIPLLVLGLPIVDTLLSMLRRFVGSTRVSRAYDDPLRARIRCLRAMFDADMGHIHHRLLALGLSHRRAVLVLYSCALGLSALALASVLAQYRNSGLVVLTAGLAVYAGIRKLGYREFDIVRSGPLLRWFDQRFFDRRFFLGFVDIVLIAAAYWISVALKIDQRWDTHAMGWFVEVFPIVLVVQLTTLFALGLYRGVWRALGVGDLIHSGLAVTAGVLVSSVVALIVEPPRDVAPSFFVIDLLLLVGLVWGSRSGYRVLHYLDRRDAAEREGVLIYGAGPAGQLVLHQILHDDSLRFRPCGFVDDEPTMRNRTLNRVPVLNSGEELVKVLESGVASTIIVSKPDLGYDEADRLVRLCERYGIRALRCRFGMEPLSASLPVTEVGKAAKAAGA